MTNQPLSPEALTLADEVLRQDGHHEHTTALAQAVKTKAARIAELKSDLAKAVNTHSNYVLRSVFDDSVETERLAIDRAETLERALLAAQAEVRDALGYLSLLFKFLAPECTPFDYLMGVCTQIDNATTIIPKLRAERNDALARLSTAERECDEYRLQYGRKIDEVNLLMRERDEARAKARTPGTVEVCELCAAPYHWSEGPDCDGVGKNIDGHKYDCPLRTHPTPET